MIYGVIKFFTEYSGRSMGDGSLIKFEKFDNKYYEISDILIPDRAINTGIAKIETGIVYVHGSFEKLRLDNEFIDRIYSKDNTEFPVIKMPYAKLYAFHCEDDESAKLLYELKGGKF